MGGKFPLWKVCYPIFMNILAFDTSSSVLSVALKTGKSKISEVSLTGFFQHAENLLPLIAKLLKKHKISIAKVDLFLLGRGPGSFTGLRVSFATVKGFLAGSSLQSLPPCRGVDGMTPTAASTSSSLPPCRGVDGMTPTAASTSSSLPPCKGALSLDMIADPIELPEKSWLGVCLDAGRQRLFFRTYQRSRQSWRPKGKIEMLSVEETAQKLPANAHITGDALRRYQKALLEAAPQKNFIPLEEKFWYPRASTLIRWATDKPEALEPLESARDFIPRYFRLSEPEEKRKHAALSC